MATISLTIPDAQAVRILAAYCGLYGYQETVDGQPNPQTRLAFAKEQLYKHIKRVVIEYEGVEAQRAAISASTTDINL